MKQGECERCEGRGETHGQDCLVRKLIFKESRAPFIVHSKIMESVLKAFEKERQMESQSITKTKKIDIGQLESIFIKGDISSMTEIQRIEYTRELCRSLGLNPMTQPFEMLNFQGKTVLYAKKGCTDQLRAIYGISLKIVSENVADGVLTVAAQASFPDGRVDEDYGCVTIGHLKGDALANAKMKALTKAKRRVTLSICGLGMLDESEIETIPGAKVTPFKKQEKEVSNTNEGPKITFKKPLEPLASEEEIKEMFSEAKASGITELASLTDYILSQFGKPKFKLLSVSELLILRDAIRDGKIRQESSLVEVESVPEENLFSEDNMEHVKNLK